MNQITYQDVINEYIRVGNVLQETYKNMDYKVGNKEGKKIVRVFKIMENDLELAMKSLPELFSSENEIVRVKAAASSIALGIFVKEAKAVLEEVGRVGNNINSFNAKMTLEVWRKQRYLKVYPEQEIRVVDIPE